ncbi:hypothetical protein FNV43_RR05705 [Rhamnella rubrinervis]|uniref:Uncharacterized protein n=1 Tax=Rhamnella rubrinervis TaxID=2594499 RepID=A0A8K0MQX0_9ROSA|nr:hypothetical protein FNV43_RR05705 [Rhamnella rubrinervis]
MFTLIANEKKSKHLIAFKYKANKIHYYSPPEVFVEVDVPTNGSHDKLITGTNQEHGKELAWTFPLHPHHISSSLDIAMLNKKLEGVYFEIAEMHWQHVKDISTLRMELTDMHRQHADEISSLLVENDEAYSKPLNEKEPSQLMFNPFHPILPMDRSALIAFIEDFSILDHDCIYVRSSRCSMYDRRKDYLFQHLRWYMPKVNIIELVDGVCIAISSCKYVNRIQNIMNSMRRFEIDMQQLHVYMDNS